MNHAIKTLKRFGVKNIVCKTKIFVHDSPNQITLLWSQKDFLSPKYNCPFCLSTKASEIFSEAQNRPLSCLKTIPKTPLLCFGNFFRSTKNILFLNAYLVARSLIWSLLILSLKRTAFSKSRSSEACFIFSVSFWICSFKARALPEDFNSLKASSPSSSKL